MFTKLVIIILLSRPIPYLRTPEPTCYNIYISHSCSVTELFMLCLGRQILLPFEIRKGNIAIPLVDQQLIQTRDGPILIGRYTDNPNWKNGDNKQ